MIPDVNKTKDELEDVDLSYSYEKSKEIKWYHQILLNRPLKVIIALIITAILGPLLIYHYVFHSSLDQPPIDGLSFGSCLVPRSARLLCGVGTMPFGQCHSQCCYDYTNNMCFHRFPSRFSYITHRIWSEEIFLSPRVATVPYASQRSISRIRLSIDDVTATHLSINFYHSEDLIEGNRLKLKGYHYEVLQPELNVIVNASDRNIFNTMRGPLIASDDIWEITFKLTNETMFGLGEIPIKTDTVKIIYNHDENLNLIPLIFAKSNGSYHGLLFDVVSPAEVSFRSENQIVVRSITKNGLKFHLFIGPKPVDIMKDAMKLLQGKRNLNYWMLGAHLCSETSENSYDIDKLRNFVNTASAERMPFDSHCGVAPIVFDNVCNNTQADLIHQGATILKNAGKRFVPHVSPYVQYTNVNTTYNDYGNEMDVISYQDCFDNVKNFKEDIIHDPLSNELYKGHVNNHDVIYPNYENITKEFMEVMWSYDGEVDGLVLENSWPLDESEKDVKEMYTFLPYFNEQFEAAFKRTPQWNATKPGGEKYLYTHNEYGNHFTDAFQKFKGLIPMLTTSQFMSRGISINRQNIPSSWSSLQRELIEASLGGISGHWLWSSPICGDTDEFNNETHTGLCVKWYMAATYLPMIKIHSKDIGRDPLSFVGNHRMYMINALNTRMCLMPYFYTVLQEGPLLRPMFYQFPSVEPLTKLTTQFSVGDDLLVVPNLQPSQSHVHVWMPPGTWYEFWSGLKIKGEEGEAVTMTTTDAEFLTLLRGGSIISLQKDVRLTNDETRLHSPFSFTVALHCSTANSKTRLENITLCSANGKLYLTNNITINFKANEKELNITAVGDNFNSLCSASEALWASKIKEINVYGLHDDKNNYDHHRFISVDIDLCALESDDEIVVKFFD